MGLNWVSKKSDMYQFVDATWNTVKGQCYHDCSYCYMKRFGELNPVRFDEKELKTDLGGGNFIFVGSSCDMWAKNIPKEWTQKTLEHCNKFDNTYLFQTKNPKNLREILPEKSIACVTIETNRHYPLIMRNCPIPSERAEQMKYLHNSIIERLVDITIEPIIDFDPPQFLEMIKRGDPDQVNIGADTGGNKLPEPDKDKILSFISELKKFTTVHLKSNLNRLIK